MFAASGRFKSKPAQLVREGHNGGAAPDTRI